MQTFYLLSKLFLILISFVEINTQTIIDGNYTLPKLSRLPVTIVYTGMPYPSTNYFLVFQTLTASIGALNEIIFSTPMPNSIKMGKPEFVVNAGGTNGNVSLTPIDSSADANTTFHLIMARMVRTGFTTGWRYTSSITQKLDTWPTSALDADTGLLADGAFNYGTSPPRSASSYTTVIAETILSFNDTVSCFVTFQSTGIIRAAYLNGNYLFSGAAKFDYFFDTIFSGLVDFTPGPHILTVFGTNINPSLSVGNCYNTSGDNVNADYQRYARMSLLLTSSQVIYYYKHTCDSTCDICSPKCQKCKSGYSFGTTCANTCSSSTSVVFAAQAIGTSFCMGSILNKITATSLSYNNITTTLTFQFRTEYPNTLIGLSIYSGDISSYLTGEMSLIATPRAVLSTKIGTTAATGVFTGSIGTAQNLAFPVASPSFTLIANLMISNSIKIYQFNTINYDYLSWITYLSNGDNITFWAPTFITFEVFYECTTSLCQVTLQNDGFTTIYLDGEIYSPSANLTSITQTVHSFPQSGVLTIKIDYVTYFKFSSPASVYARSDFIYNHKFCIDDWDTRVVKDCSCQFPCLDCANSPILNCLSCYNDATLNAGVCECNATIGTVPDSITKTCQCPWGVYLNPAFGNCSGFCNYPCQTCRDNSGTCDTCQYPTIRNSSGYCNCNYPWSFPVNSTVCNYCLGFMQGLDCVVSCSANASIDYIRRECIICSTDFDCSNMLWTPYCSINTTYCVGFKASIVPVFINKINPTLSNTISAAVVDYLGLSANLADYQYIWQNDFGLPFYQVGNSMIIPPFSNITNYPSSFVVTLVVKHIATGNTSMASTTIRVNRRPVISNIITTPNTGYAWKDIFNLTAVVIDTESDYPITTTWYYYGDNMQRLVMQAADRTTSFTGKLPMGSQDIGLPYRALLILSVDAVDSSGLISSSPFGVIMRIEYIPIRQISNIVTTANVSNITQIQDVSNTVLNLKVQDRDSLKYATNPCLIDCHARGACINSACACNPGFTLPDCSMTFADFLQNLVVKGQIIDYLKKVCTQNTMVTNSTIYYCFEIMVSITSNIYLSPESVAQPVLTLSIEMLFWIQNLILDDATIIQISGLIDNFLDYPTSDCSKVDGFGFIVLDNIKTLMDYLHLLLVNKATIDGDWQIVLVNNFKMFSSRVTTARLPGKVIRPSSLLDTDPYMIFPGFGFSFSDVLAGIQYILWNPKIFDCKKSSPMGVTMVLKKDMRIIDLDYSMSAGYEILYNSVPSGFSCPGSCVMQLAGVPTICSCNDKLTLTIQSYILRNSPQSNVVTPATYDHSGAVILNAVLGSVCFVHMFAAVLLDIYKKKDIGINVNNLNSLGQVCVYLMVTHSFFSTIFKYDQENPRALRSFIYYLRLLGFEVLGMLFINQNKNTPSLVLFFLKISAIFLVSLYSKIIYDLLITNDILIGAKGDFRVKKRPADTSLAAVSRSLGLLMMLAVFSCSIAGIVLLLNTNTDESYPYFKNSFTIFYNCLLIDFFAFQVLKVFVQMWILSGTTSRIMRSRRIRSFTRSVVERYFLRYYTIFWVKERKNLQMAVNQ